MKTDQIQHSLVAAADAIASGEISSRELTESCIARIERLQPVLNCFISPEVENALAAAEAAEEAMRWPGTRAPTWCKPRRQSPCSSRPRAQ